ncbi:dienelactone hydrolase family protein [Dietzia sp. ANT_WB102]|uniref:dienelactone hydrolase family protein n=1 Tax=Dietzia sp. ANT_WB102 TaxID=2597345 RepID=UPI0011ECB927|nr:dienelactone hydrolase family protein [Dietzia sp. ANT_WB102]KAA0918456.1 dienelactone hydrolase family protein [Dietzia sp. ANT_WB102]
MAVDLGIQMADGTAEAFVSRPRSADRELPGVLLFSDIFGLRPQIRTMMDRIASWGYVVLAPNVFYRSGTVTDLAPTVDLREPGERERYFAIARPRMEELTSELSRPDAVAYLDALLALPGVAGDAGVIGYCMGARLAMRLGGDRPDRVAAVGGFHGGGLATDEADSPHRSVATTRAAILLRHADDDPSMPPGGMDAIASVARGSGVPLDQAVYPGAPHGYSMADTPTYDESAAERHFEDLREHLARRLAR